MLLLWFYTDVNYYSVITLQYRLGWKVAQRCLSRIWRRMMMMMKWNRTLLNYVSCVLFEIVGGIWRCVFNIAGICEISETVKLPGPIFKKS